MEKRKVRGYAAFSATERLRSFEFERRALREDDVAIRILYCGVCHTDIHNTRNDWGNANYPMVPGHEIIGVVVGVGSSASRFSVGENVGVGVIIDSCRQCAKCNKGFEQYCESGATSTYNKVDKRDGTRTFGGYSESIVVSERFVLKIPVGLDLKDAAPLLCAGITTYSPLRHWGVNESSKVAVIGLGGLGHMALKLASAMGAEVALITRSPGKAQDARSFGATEVIDSTSAQSMASVKDKFDLVIDTVPYQHDVNPYVSTLNVGGTLVLVGYFGPLEPPVNCSPMLSLRKSVSGSYIGGMEETQEMLNFCGEHNISCEVELIKMADIDICFERMLKSDVRYRFVIDFATL